MHSSRFLFAMGLVLASCSQQAPNAGAATYKVGSANEFRAIMPKLAPGDVVDMGNAFIGPLFFRQGKDPRRSVDRLSGVTLKGGRFTTLRFDDAVNLTLDGGRVEMPVTDETRRMLPAILFYRPTGVTIRNYEVSTDRSAGIRPGYGIRFDNRGGGGNVTVEDTLIHDIASGIVAAMPRDLVIRRVTTRAVSADAFFISAGDGVLFDQVFCDRFEGTDQSKIHSDCIQIDKIAGPTANLTIKDLKVRQDTDFAQWIFGPEAKTGGRHRNWKITGTRGVGNTWRALSAHGVDGLVIEDNVMLTPSPPAKAARGGSYATMMDVANSTDVVLKNNTACRHFRTNNKRISETGTKTARCK